jgi:N-acetylmuramoyl-L-alanine amidase
MIVQTNFKYSKPLIPLAPDKVLFIILHHPDAVKLTPEQIHQIHLKKKYSGFGYNEYITKDGTVYIGRGDHIGAQCANMNSKSYGICCEGDYQTEKEMPEAQFNALIERLKYHKTRFKNLVQIAPHSRFNPTACPGVYFPLQRVLTALEPCSVFEQAVKYFSVKAGIDAKYWLGVKGKMVPGEYAVALISKIYKSVKG